MIAIGWIRPNATEPGQAEEVSPAELRELRRKQPGVEDGPDLGSEFGVDHRQEKAPDRERERHDAQLQPLRSP